MLTQGAADLRGEDLRRRVQRFTGATGLEPGCERRQYVQMCLHASLDKIISRSARLTSACRHDSDSKGREDKHGIRVRRLPPAHRFQGRGG